MMLKKEIILIMSLENMIIDSFQFLSSELDSLVKNSSKDDFKYLSQICNNNVLDQFKRKGFYPHEYMSDFEKFKDRIECSCMLF